MQQWWNIVHGKQVRYILLSPLCTAHIIFNLFLISSLCPLRLLHPHFSSSLRDQQAIIFKKIVILETFYFSKTTLSGVTFYRLKKVSRKTSIHNDGILKNLLWKTIPILYKSNHIFISCFFKLVLNHKNDFIGSFQCTHIWQE